MKQMSANKPSHIVAGNVFDALGFSASEATVLKIKAEILSAILEHVRQNGYTQRELVDMLDEYQPSFRLEILTTSPVCGAWMNWSPPM